MPAMFNAMHGIYDPENPDYMKPRYSMDDVMFDADDKLQLLKWLIGSGYDAEDCMTQVDDLKAIFLSARDEVKEELREVLEGCVEVTPKDYLMGYAKER